MTDLPPVPSRDTPCTRDFRINRKQLSVDLLIVLSGLADRFNPVRGESSLWRAVILQALIDAASGSKKDEAVRDRREARRWLLTAGTDFEEVCHLAGYAPDYVRRRIKAALASDAYPQSRSVPLPSFRLTPPPLRPKSSFKTPALHLSNNAADRSAYPPSPVLELVVHRDPALLDS